LRLRCRRRQTRGRRIHALPGKRARGEKNDRDRRQRRPLPMPCQWQRPAAAHIGENIVDPDWLEHGLDPPLAGTLIADLEPVLDLIISRAGDDDSPGGSERLQPRRDVDAIAVNIAVLDDDIAEIDPDAELELLARRLAEIVLRYGALDIHS